MLHRRSNKQETLEKTGACAASGVRLQVSVNQKPTGWHVTYHTLVDTTVVRRECSETSGVCVMVGIGLTLRWTVRGVWCRRVSAHGGMNISGVNTPMIYVGQAMSPFALHYEDNALLSISFLHRGANKIWYLSHLPRLPCHPLFCPSLRRQRLVVY